MSFGGPKVKPQQTPVMPDEQDPQVVEARRRRALEVQTRGGRQSTILTGGSASSGQGNQTLGGAQ
ncbi:hypothetical protein R5W60_04540 [Brucella pseudintermedia]|uniref:hypothetical protein n=1 Tax=Brucella pseudintermedia TaxID=370111 RepID=UPI00366AAB5E|nr:hypothetical protein R5W60_04540 [Brucella pseudintermedia]